MAEVVQTVPIDPEGRYVIIVSFPEGQETSLERIRELGEMLADWWKSQSPFFILPVFDGIEVRFERVESV